MAIAERIAAVRRRMEEACRRVGRDPAGVRLVAVSKTKPAQAVTVALACGQTLFGENYVQEFVEKREQVEQVAPGAEWHFIGSLQSNKVKYLAGKVTLVHSVDRLALAEEIDRQWGKLGQTADILLEANLGGEASKAGVAASSLEELARAVARLPHVRVCGLMVLPPFFDDPERVRPFFRELRQLAEHLESLEIPGVAMRELSMGMSGDFEAAIEEGATLVRVGTALVGAR